MSLCKIIFEASLIETYKFSTKYVNICSYILVVTTVHSCIFFIKKFTSLPQQSSVQAEQAVDWSGDISVATNFLLSLDKFFFFKSY